MKRFVALTLGGLALGYFINTANAQYPYSSYPYAAYPAVYYPQPMPYSPIQMVSHGMHMPWTGQATIVPMAAPVYVPVERVRYVPVFGPVETMPEGGPLASWSVSSPSQQPKDNRVASEKKPNSTSTVVHTVQKPGVSVQETREKSAVTETRQKSVPWTKKVQIFLFGPTTTK